MKQNSKKNTTAVLLVTDKSSTGILNLYNDLKSALNNTSDVFIAYHIKNGSIPKNLELTDIFVFSDEILSNIGYIPIGETLVPGNNHFPLLDFYKKNNNYEKYWVIEDDVRFTGDWKFLLNSIDLMKADFVSSIIRPWHEEPNWYWWNKLNHPTKWLPIEKRLASFNPIYRISNEALSFIDLCLKDKWQGHHEVLLPSLLNSAGFTIADFGGDGAYVPKGFKNKFYHLMHAKIDGVSSEGTMRHKPIMSHVGHLKNTLYHPVKNFDENIIKYYSTSEFRLQWIDKMNSIARPVIENLANDKLKEQMVVHVSKNIDHESSRRKVSYLEAFARTFSGIAPWLNSNSGDKEEQKLRKQYREWVLNALANAVNPKANDYMVWEGGQALVDASYVALGLIRCPWIWEKLDNNIRLDVIKAFDITRNTVPVYTNWILFSAMIETFFCRYGYRYDIIRIEYAIREFLEHWYVGDGMFSDGMPFHFDYYNSYVIQPYISTILDVVNLQTGRYNNYNEKFDQIAKRYAEIQERLINTDGSFPAIGRSITYRSGAFHHLADMALKKRLPDSLLAAQVRDALYAVIKRTLEAPNSFDENGWLNIGLYGDQPEAADFYITTGSLYLCMNAFLPLGLPNSDIFWYANPEPWTSVKIWNGENVGLDHALDL